MSKPSPSFEPTRRRQALLRLGAALALLLATLHCPLSARAQSSARLLDAPRAAGTVGERYDGYAVVRGAAPADIASLVEKVNAERRALYAQRAKSEGVPVEAIGKIYAGEIVKSAPAGTWFLAENGQWKQK
jgi:uncharacterized protein YdbL (DUF1318 family)